jgi:predicted membrane chloride channel (bestrophin family)
LREEKARAARTPTGLRGLWGWITGKNRKIRQENETEIARTQMRDSREKQDVVRKQLAERRTLQRQVKLAGEQQQKVLTELNQDVARAKRLGQVPEHQPARDRKRTRERTKRDGRSEDRFGPTLDHN